MKQKEHDIMMDLVDNQGATFHDMIVSGLTTENTSLLDKSVYKDDPWILELFSKDGKFDVQSFNQAYDLAKLAYNSLASADYNESMKKLATFHRDNIFAPIDLKRQGPEFKEFILLNPRELTSSLFTLGKEGPRTLSDSEIALKHHVLLNPTSAGDDLSNAKWGDSPNDNFTGYFFDTLVLALYDSAGTHTNPITGEIEEHLAGELKLDNGDYYYERLDGRSVANKRVLNKLNTLTIDGSRWNEYDFFDSDDATEKSAGGAILKNLALVGSMFLPYVGPWIAGLSVGILAVGLLGTLGKVFTGSNSPVFNDLEGWAKTMNRLTAVTEAAQLNPWGLENMINLIGDSIGLIVEQRVIFTQAPKIFKGLDNPFTEEGKAALKVKFTKEVEAANKLKLGLLAKDGAARATLAKERFLSTTVLANLVNSKLDIFTKGYLNLGRALSMGYMTAITVQDMYNEAKLAGAEDWEASALTLGYAAAEAALLRTGIGELVMPELRAEGYELRSIVKKALGVARKEGVTNTINKEGRKKGFQKLFNFGKNIWSGAYVNGTRTVTAIGAAGLGEGLEEVSEEVLADACRGIYSLSKWLSGNNSRMDTFGYNFKEGKWDSGEVFNRYALNFVGGVIGGSVANAGLSIGKGGIKFNTAEHFKAIDSMTTELAQLLLIYQMRNGLTNKILRIIDKSTLGDKNLSASGTYTESNEGIVFDPGTETDNLDLLLKRMAKDTVNYILTILDANGAKSDSEFILSLLPDLRLAVLQNTSVSGLLLQRYNSLNSTAVLLVKDMNALVNKVQDTNDNGKVEDWEIRKGKLTGDDLKNYLDKEKLLKEVRKLLKDLNEGKMSYDFIKAALFEATTGISGEFTTPTFGLYAEARFKKPFSLLTEHEKETAFEEYKGQRATLGRDNVWLLSLIFYDYCKQSSKLITDSLNTYSELPTFILHLNQIKSLIYLQAAIVPEGTVDIALTDNSVAQLNAIYALISQYASENEKLELKDILKLRDNIPEEFTKEEKEAILKLISDLLWIKSFQIIGNHALDILNQIIDYGYATAETKQLVHDLVDTAYNSIMPSETDNSLSFDEYELVLINWEDNLNIIQQQLRALDALPETPLAKLFSDMTAAVNGEAISISLVIDNLTKLYNSNENKQEFLLPNEDSIYQARAAIQSLRLLRAAIGAASTDSASHNNLFGYNVTLNEVALKLGILQNEKLAEIPSSIANIYRNEIDGYINKLNFLLLLNELNSGNKLNKHSKVSLKKDMNIYSTLRTIITVPDELKAIDEEAFNRFAAIINSALKHQDLFTLGDYKLSDEVLEEYEKENIAIENAIFDYFNTLLKDKNHEERVKILKKFISPKRFDLYTKPTGVLDDSDKLLTTPDILWWFCSRMALKSEDFYHEFEQIIDPNNPIIPVATLELAIYNNYAYILNMLMYADFKEAYLQSIAEDWYSKSIDDRKTILMNLGYSSIGAEKWASNERTKYYLAFLSDIVPKYNIALTEGGAGVGKSSGVLYYVSLLLKTFHKDELLKNAYIAHGVNDSGATKLVRSLGLEQVTSGDRSKLMKAINTEWIDFPSSYDSNALMTMYDVPSNAYTLNDNNTIVSTAKPSVTSEPFSVIIIDEISRFSSLDLDQLLAYSEKYGVPILVAGDFNQLGIDGSIEVKIENEKETFSIASARALFAHCPKLGISMRTDNTLKTENQLSFLYWMDTDKSEDLNLLWTVNENGLFGDYVHTLVNNTSPDSIKLAIKDKIQAMIDSLLDGEKITLLYLNEESNIYKLFTQDEDFKDYIEVVRLGDALGSESRYYLILTDSTNSSREFYTTAIYTGMTRAILGSIIFNTSSLPIKSSKNPSPKALSESLSETSKKDYSTKRKNILRKISQGGNSTKYNLYTINSSRRQPTLPPEPTEGLLSGTELINPNTEEVNKDKHDPEKMMELISTPAVTLEYNLDNDNNHLEKISYLELVDTFPDRDKRFFFIYDKDNKIAPVELINLPFTSEINSKWVYGSTNIILDGNNFFCVVNIDGQYVTFTKSEDESWHPFNNDIDTSIGEVLDLLIPNPSGPTVSILSIPELKVLIDSTLTLDEYDLAVELLSNRYLLLPDTIKPEPLEYDDFKGLALEDGGLSPEEEVKNRIDVSSESEESNNEVEDKGDLPKSITQNVYSFNTFEVGNIFDDNGQIISSGSIGTNGYDLADYLSVRIDSINGLKKIDAAKNPPVVHTDAEYIEILGKLRNAFFHIKDKNALLQKISEILELPNLYCTFALKSRPKDKSGTEPYASKIPSPINAHSDEGLLYNESNDIRSLETNKKTIVAIIGDTRDRLEIPLFTLSSPFTLLMTEDSNGYVFGEMSVRYAELVYQLKLNGTLNLVSIATALINEFDKPEYKKFKNLINLLKLWLRDDGYVIFHRDNEWTPAKNLEYLGPLMSTKRGKHQIAPGFGFNENTNPEQEWLSVWDFTHGHDPRNPITNLIGNRPGMVFTSNMYLSFDGLMDGLNLKTLLPGHNFILAVQGTEEEFPTDEDIMDRYIAEQNDSSLPQRVKVIYILPPKATVREYVDNLKAIATPSTQTPTLHIGNIFTSYNLLKKAFNDTTFTNRFIEKFGLYTYDTLTNYILKLDLAADGKEKLLILRELTDAFKGEMYSNMAVVKALNTAILYFAYNKVTPPEVENLPHVRGLATYIPELSQEDFAILDNALKDVTIFHSTHVFHDTLPIKGLYVPIHDNTNIKRENAFMIDGKPFKIHGKLDSVLFRGNFDDFIEYCVAENGVMYLDSSGHWHSKDSNGVVKQGEPIYMYHLKANPNGKYTREIYTPGHSNLNPVRQLPIQTREDRAKVQLESDIASIEALVKNLGYGLVNIREYFKEGDFEKGIINLMQDLWNLNIPVVRIGRTELVKCAFPFVGYQSEANNNLGAIQTDSDGLGLFKLYISYNRTTLVAISVQYDPTTNTILGIPKDLQEYFYNEFLLLRLENPTLSVDSYLNTVEFIKSAPEDILEFKDFINNKISESLNNSDESFNREEVLETGRNLLNLLFDEDTIGDLYTISLLFDNDPEVGITSDEEFKEILEEVELDQLEVLLQAFEAKRNELNSPLNDLKYARIIKMLQDKKIETSSKDELNQYCLNTIKVKLK